jgi:hypothetical protein
MTSDEPGRAGPEGPWDTPSAGPASRQARPVDREQPSQVILRQDKPPVDQLDFDDRHDTRATMSEEMSQRYAFLRRDRRRDDWHYLAMGLVVFVVGVAVYLAGYIVVLLQAPHLNQRQAAQIAGLAFVAAGGGVAARSSVRTLKGRFARVRDRNSRPD